MRKRPWEIVLLTVLYAGAPFGNLVFTCLVRGYDLSALPWLMLVMTPVDWLALAVYPALAAAVWSVSRPGWWIFVGLNAVLFSYNFYVGSQVPGANLLVLAGANGLNVTVAALLFTKHARSPYFSPRLRWWNAEVRYRVVYVLEVPLKILGGGREAEGLLLDLSVTGCFADLPEGFELNQPVGMTFSCWGLTIECLGRIRRRSGPGESLSGYGIEFIRLTANQRHHLRSLVKVLKAHSVPSREERVTIQRHPGITAGANVRGSSSEEADASLR